MSVSEVFFLRHISLEIHLVEIGENVFISRVYDAFDEGVTHMTGE